MMESAAFGIMAFGFVSVVVGLIHLLDGFDEDDRK